MGTCLSKNFKNVKIYSENSTFNSIQYNVLLRGALFEDFKMISSDILRKCQSIHYLIFNKSKKLLTCDNEIPSLRYYFQYNDLIDDFNNCHLKLLKKHKYKIRFYLWENSINSIIIVIDLNFTILINTKWKFINPKKKNLKPNSEKIYSFFSLYL